MSPFSLRQRTIITMSTFSLCLISFENHIYDFSFLSQQTQPSLRFLFVWRQWNHVYVFYLSDNVRKHIYVFSLPEDNRNNVNIFYLSEDYRNHGHVFFSSKDNRNHIYVFTLSDDNRKPYVSFLSSLKAIFQFNSIHKLYWSPTKIQVHVHLLQ